MTVYLNVQTNKLCCTRGNATVTGGPWPRTQVSLVPNCKAMFPAQGTPRESLLGLTGRGRQIGLSSRQEQELWVSGYIIKSMRCIHASRHEKPRNGSKMSVSCSAILSHITIYPYTLNKVLETSHGI